MRPRRQSAEFRESSQAAVSHYGVSRWINLAAISTILLTTPRPVCYAATNAPTCPEDTP